MTKKSLLTMAALAALVLSLFLPVASFAVQYDGAAIKEQFHPQGFTDSIHFDDGKLFIDSTRTDATKFRWVRLNAPQQLGGDIQLQLDYTLNYLNHFTGIELELRSLEKDAFSVSLRREQRQAGKHFLTAVITVGGKQVLKQEKPFGAYIGALCLQRTGKRLVLSALDSKGKIHPVAEYEDFPALPASGAIKFTAAPRTHGKVQLRSFQSTCTQRLDSARYPVFAPQRLIGEATLFPMEGVVAAASGECTLQPGQTVIAAVRGVANLRNIQLAFNADAPVKVTAFQCGNQEPAVTGEVLHWDEANAEIKSAERRIHLGGWLGRHCRDRQWDYSMISLAPCFFFEFTPAGNAPVRLSQVSLHAAPLAPATPLDGAIANSHFNSQGVLIPQENGQPILLSGKTLPITTGQAVGDGFVANNLLLDGEESAITIPVNRNAQTIGMLHAAGKQPAKSAAALAACQILYTDGTTATEFFTLRWNTGIYNMDFMPRGFGDFSWWGPISFPRSTVLPFPKGAYGEIYDALHYTRMINPHPEKTIRKLTLYKLPGNNCQFLTCGIRLDSPQDSASYATIEADESALVPGKEVTVRILAHGLAAKRLPQDGNLPIFLTRGKERYQVASAKVRHHGDFAIARSTITIPKNHHFQPGPAFLNAQGITSPRLGVMPEEHGKFLYTIIAGFATPRVDFDRIRRIGFDTVKIVTPWEESPEGNITFSRMENYTRFLRENGLNYTIRNHIRMNRGPKYFADQATFLQRYHLDGRVEARPQIDPADSWAVERIVNLYRETARQAIAHNAASINANYGLRPETGLRRVEMGQASLKQFRELLQEKFPLEQLNKATGMTYRSHQDFQPLDLYKDASGFLLKEYLRMHHANLAKAQRAVTQAIREEGYTGHLTYNVSFHPIEHILIGANTRCYLELSREFPPASLFHESSDRYSLSFAKWMLAKRTLDLPYGDEGCLTPPPDMPNRMAFIWMAMMQCFDTITCQWFAGKPGMLELGSLKSLHGLLYDAEYLPDDFSLAMALDSGFSEAPKTIRSTLHGSTTTHYALASTLRELNLNPDRYVVDAFPELHDQAKGKLIIDDISRAISPEFAQQLEGLIRSGKVFLASVETDEVNNHAFLRRFQIHPEKIAKDAMITRNVGKGKVVFLNRPWFSPGWEPGLPQAQRQQILELLTQLGDFTPLVQCDTPNVMVTPYRAKNGDLLLQVVNIRSTAATTTVRWKKSLATEKYFDHTTGETGTPSTDGEYHTAQITINPLDATVLRIRRSHQP